MDVVVELTLGAAATTAVLFAAVFLAYVPLVTDGLLDCRGMCIQTGPPARCRRMGPFELFTYHPVLMILAWVRPYWPSRFHRTAERA